MGPEWLPSLPSQVLFGPHLKAQGPSWAPWGDGKAGCFLAPTTHQQVSEDLGCRYCCQRLERTRSTGQEWVGRSVLKPQRFIGSSSSTSFSEGLSSARMPTESDASAATASTSSGSAPGTLGTQTSGQEARRCMQPQYLL